MVIDGAVRFKFMRVIGQMLLMLLNECLGAWLQRDIPPLDDTFNLSYLLEGEQLLLVSVWGMPVLLFRVAKEQQMKRFG